MQESQSVWFEAKHYFSIPGEMIIEGGKKLHRKMAKGSTTSSCEQIQFSGWIEINDFVP